MFHNPFEYRLRLVLAIIMGVLFGLIFLRLDYDQQAFQNISSIIFLMMVNVTFVYVEHNADVI